MNKASKIIEEKHQKIYVKYMMLKYWINKKIKNNKKRIKVIIKFQKNNLKTKKIKKRNYKINH